jgi:para-nitrobenzyl esterase
VTRNWILRTVASMQVLRRIIHGDGRRLTLLAYMHAICGMYTAAATRNSDALALDDDSRLDRVTSDDLVSAPPAATVKAWRAARFDIETVWNVTYARALNCNGVGFNSAPGACKQMELQLDVHSPARNKSTGAEPPTMRRPAVVFFHGGGWEGGDRSGAGGQIYMRDNMFRWASRGFVVFNVDYRLGTDPTKPCPGHDVDDNTTIGYSVCGNFPACCEGPSRLPWPDDACQLGTPQPTLFANASLCPPIATSYPASRDAKAAVRYVRANALKYGISGDHIIAAGCSAGGWTATTLAIAAERDFKDELSVGEDPTLSTTNLQTSSSVAASVVMSGGPQAFDTMAEAVGAEFMSPYDPTDAPMIVLHGDIDPAVNVSNAYRNWRAYNRTGVLFEAHIFPSTKHCEKDVESEESVEKLSIPFVARATGIVLQD